MMFLDCESNERELHSVGYQTKTEFSNENEKIENRTLIRGKVIKNLTYQQC